MGSTTCGPAFQPAGRPSRLDMKRAAIALSHNPDTVDLPVWGDYEGWILAGHTHGGQCKPPFLPPPVLPVRNRRYTAGEFQLAGNRQLYISRGVGHTCRSIQRPPRGDALRALGPSRLRHRVGKNVDDQARASVVENQVFSDEAILDIGRQHGQHLMTSSGTVDSGSFAGYGALTLNGIAPGLSSQWPPCFPRLPHP